MGPKPIYKAIRVDVFSGGYLCFYEVLVMLRAEGYWGLHEAQVTMMLPYVLVYAFLLKTCDVITVKYILFFFLLFMFKVTSIRFYTTSTISTTYIARISALTSSLIKPPLRSSSFLLAWHVYLQHPVPFSGN